MFEEYTGTGMEIHPTSTARAVATHATITTHGAGHPAYAPGTTLRYATPIADHVARTIPRGILPVARRAQ